MMHLLAAALAAATLVGQSAASKLHPPVLPLTVRNPYLSTWLQNAREEPWTRWPMFWTGEEIGLSVIAGVHGSDIVYPLLGRPQDSLLPVNKHDGYNVSYVTYLGATYDASITNLTYSIPPPSSNYSKDAVLTISFLSPITPTSTLRQSIPASYLSVHAEGEFDISIYIDINGQWVSGDRANKIDWELHQDVFEKGGGLKTFKFQRQTEQLFTEHFDRSEWGSLYFTAPLDVHHQAGISADTRIHFSSKKELKNEVDDRYRGIMEEEPIFAFSKKLSLNSSSKTDSVLFTLTHVQDPVVQFAAARGLTMMRPLWASYFHTVADLLRFHYADFKTAVGLANEYSHQLAEDAFKSGADDYVQIVALTARQVMGATTFSGTPEDPILFMKEISSNGNFQTIDVIFPSFPFFLYTNPKWLAYLLEPLIEHMLSGQYPNKYAMHDLGTHFPNATGHGDGNDEYMPVEECGNILMMGLALANSLRYEDAGTAGSRFVNAKTTADGKLEQDDFEINMHDDKSTFPLVHDASADIKYIDDRWGGSSKGEKQAQKWVQRSYPLWKQWTGYLVKYALRPENQLSTDDFAGWLALQTNLALKGIIGIKAMAGLAEIAGEDEDAKHFDKVAREYVGKWEEYGISRDKTHAKLAYDWYGSWTTLYNLYGDALLCFHLEGTDTSTSETSIQGGGDQKPIKDSKGGKGDKDKNGKSSKGFVPRHIYQMHSDWYHFVRQKFGLPLDNRHLYTKTDWEFFAMAVAGEDTRTEILESVAYWLNETVTDRPFTDLHNTEGDGGFPGPNFFARPVIGGHFAFLTLERACGGKATDGLKFLDQDKDEERLATVKAAAMEFVGADRSWKSADEL